MTVTSLAEELYKKTCETGKGTMIDEPEVIFLQTINLSSGPSQNVILFFDIPYFDVKRNKKRRMKFDEIVFSTIQEFVDEENERLQASHKKLPWYKRLLESEEVVSERRNKLLGQMVIQPQQLITYERIIPGVEVYRAKRLQRVLYTSEERSPIFYIWFFPSPAGSCPRIEGARLLDKVLGKATLQDETFKEYIDILNYS